MGYDQIGCVMKYIFSDLNRLLLFMTRAEELRNYIYVIDGSDCVTVSYLRCRQSSPLLVNVPRLRLIYHVSTNRVTGKNPYTYPTVNILIHALLARIMALWWA